MAVIPAKSVRRSTLDHSSIIEGDTMNPRISALLIGPVLALQGCAGAEMQKALQDGIPLVNVIRQPDGTETVFTGLIQPRMDFSSSVATRSADGVACNGEFNNRGVGAISCTNGWKLNLTIPQDKYGTLNGSYIEANAGIGSAVGWGTEANPDLLRSLF